MSTKSHGIGGRVVLAIAASSLALGGALLWGANRLFLDRKPDTATPDLLLNEGLLLLSLLVLQALVVGVLGARLTRPLSEIGRLMEAESSPPVGSGKVPQGLGEITYVYQNALRLLQGRQGVHHAQEELDRVRADAERIRSAVAALDREPRPKFTPQTDVVLDLAREIERHLREIQDLREENAAVAFQIETEGREAVLAAREASSLAESAYLEASELGVALRDLNRVIGEIRPVLEAETLPARSGADPGGAVGRACRILSDVADRHRLIASRISRGAAEGSAGLSETQGGLSEELGHHLAEIDAHRREAEDLLAQASAPAGAEMAERARPALKKLLQSAEIAQERLSRLAAAAERASSAARRTTGLTERELQSLEALGVRLERESGPVEPAETLGEADFIQPPEA